MPESHDSAPRRVLIADDDPVSRRLLRTMLLGLEYEVVVCNNGQDAWDTLRRPDAPKIAILDWLMPGMDGTELCRRIRAEKLGHYTYIIMLTARSNREDLVEAMEAGADDYLVKPSFHDELRARLRAGCRIMQMQEQLLATREALRNQATHDPLTGLWNRGAALDILRREYARAERLGASLCVAMADLDHFKHVNDTWGHLGGDAVLREVARRIVASARAYDTVARYGGEEFIIIASDCDAPQTISLAERIRAAVSNKSVAIPEGQVNLTISIGAANAKTTQIPTIEEYLAAADKAMYQAKALGRNRVSLAATARHAVPKNVSNDPDEIAASEAPPVAYL